MPYLDDDIWKKSYESDDKTVQSYYAKTDEGKLMGKGVAVFPFKPEKVMKYARKFENRPFYDEHYIEGKVVDKIEDKDNGCDFFFYYTSRGKIKLVDDRDFVIATTAIRVGDAIYSAFHSFEHPDYPEKKGFVRAQLDFYLWRYAPGDDGKGCKVTRIYRGDPKGSLPDFLKDLIIKKSGQELLDMRKSMLE